ncbi:MAG TPA: TonB-dependent receptor [Steroidobacteraceae bacterium]|jgi:iron complex outermembrane receptor protein|nr:TonB-dependent receptor [Steroidobacteraceae bacterium]
MKILGIAGSVAALALTLNVAVAQKVDTPADTGAAVSANELAEVIVTGTRRLDRTVAESSAPIDVITGTELTNYPAASMLDTLSNLVPSFIVGQNSISDASSFVRSPSLRGLPADEMLVMLNGKRMNRSALVQVYQGGETELAFGSQGPDLNSIPSIAVKSLEILRDGASAQYGSDAIAGVLNYQFKNNPSGIQIDGRYGEYFPTGFPRDGGDGLLAANVGLPLGSQGFVNLSAEWAKSEQTVRNPTRPSALAFAENFPALAPQLPNYPGPVQQWGTPPSDSVKTFLNSGIKLDNGDQIYFFANYANIQMNESFNYRLPVTVTDTSGNTYGNHPAFNNIYLDPCTPALTGCPTGGYINDSNTFNFNSVYPAGFTPRFFDVTQQFFGAVGYKGTNRWGINYDVSGTTAQNSVALSLRTSINPSLGPQSPTSFYDGKFIQKENNFNLDLSYPWTVPGLASPVSIAGGFEWRDENYQQLLGDAASYAAGPYASQPLYNCAAGACTPALDATGHQITATQSTASNGYGGISAPVDASQVSYAGYLDVEADVLRDLTLGLAGRMEHYASFGDTTLGKAQARWKVVDWLALRGTVSTGFHAPTPGQNNVETLSTTFLPGTTTQVQIGTYPVTSADAKYYGAVPLKPEESTNLSAGIVLTPLQNLLVTIDGYEIKVRNRIGISQQFNVTQADIANLPALAYIGAGGTVQYFTNGFNTRTRGLDVVATYPLSLGIAGTLDSAIAYNYNKTDVTKFDPTVISPARIVDIQHYAPNNRVNINESYSWGPIRALLRENYYGTFRDQNDYPGQLFGATYTTDLELGYQVIKNLLVAVGGRNIFNEFPDKIANTAASPISPITGGEQDGELYPRTGGPFGFNGAFWYLRVSASF